MEKYSLNIDAPIVGGYFSSEQIDLLSIIRCNTPEELVDFVNNCIQVKDIYTNEELLKLIESIGLDNAKRRIFKDYQDSMAPHNSRIDVVMTNTFQHLGIKHEDIVVILNAISELSQDERIHWAREYIEKNYPDRSDEIFYALQNFRSIERDQNKSDNQYDEIIFIMKKKKKKDTVLI